MIPCKNTLLSIAGFEFYGATIQDTTLSEYMKRKLDILVFSMHSPGRLEIQCIFPAEEELTIHDYRQNSFSFDSRFETV